MKKNDDYIAYQVDKGFSEDEIRYFEKLRKLQKIAFLKGISIISAIGILLFLIAIGLIMCLR